MAYFESRPFSENTFKPKYCEVDWETYIHQSLTKLGETPVSIWCVLDPIEDEAGPLTEVQVTPQSTTVFLIDGSDEYDVISVVDPNDPEDRYHFWKADLGEDVFDLILTKIQPWPTTHIMPIPVVDMVKHRLGRLEVDLQNITGDEL